MSQKLIQTEIQSTTTNSNRNGFIVFTAESIIRNKRDGHELSKEEIDFLISGYSQGNIPDYQMSAWLMAVYYKGMNPRETAHLTMAMVRSGEQLDLSSIPGIKVDKHSTGGVGDKITLALAALVAAAGVKVAKMSGRGLGHTGGTIDKLDALGLSTDLSPERFIELVNRTGIAVMGQTADLAPADKKLYALRDVTGTVESIPLIASSIMSKKIFAGADKIVLDVKTGSGAFMKTEKDAVELAEAMVAIGKEVGREVVAIITSMEQPLGYAVGNANEVMEAIETLRKNGPADLTELCLTLGSHMVVLAGKANTEAEARAILERCIEDGSALGKLKEFITNQHGISDAILDLTLLPQAAQVVPVFAGKSGYVQAIDAEAVGHCAMLLGAGRETKEDEIDHAVGITLTKKIGDQVAADAPIATLYVNNTEKVEDVKRMLTDAYTIGEERIAPPELIRRVV
ncbi:pyrimidine-nucleoside phosphorylase [Shimazuella kribbensis]|uniref:pyrimidine-nucleoside phosphorylase n=1 Tax=Shimazuella kribbensis TaxID=139808 RepID=UPI0009FC6E82|nr:pyrimidine-nucleoside phosphorylase [Shimazuella kribbensis]